MQIGWNMTIETTNGIVGLWTCWLGNGFKLFYPSEVTISDEVIMKALGVTLAKPVKNVVFGTRLWAKYYSERLGEGGRVWIDQTADEGVAEVLYTIEDAQLKGHSCGGRVTNTISTYAYHFFSEAEPDAPNCTAENIQAYKDKFIQLLVEIAKIVGDITAINLDSGLVLYTPKLLDEKGYHVENWKKGCQEYCYAQDDNLEIILKKGNSLVPWRTIIRYPVTNEVTAEELTEFVNKFDNSEN